MCNRQCKRLRTATETEAGGARNCSETKHFNK
jgi:hypothetical protein